MPQDLKPHKVTKPIQLLAAWLVGLVLVDGAFLGAANVLSSHPWLTAVLVIAAVCNVPLFLLCIFLLQTRFRPQMQEDTFYSRYLRIQQETGKRISTDAITELRQTTAASHGRLSEGLGRLETSIGELRSKLALEGSRDVTALEGALVQSEKALDVVRRDVRWSAYRVAINDLLPNFREM